MKPFEKDSVVCFLGDSITHAGGFIRRVYDYYRRTLKIPCEMYNCGVSGDNSEHGLGRLDETLFIHNPTDVVIDFGMNDINYMLYDGRSVTHELIAERRAAIDSAIANITKLVNTFKSRGIRVILCSPTPYDELTDSEVFCNEGTQAALKTVSDCLKTLAESEGIDFADFNTNMYKLMKKFYKDGHKLHADDRIHPDPVGHEAMARIFLNAMGHDVDIKDSYEELLKIADSKYDEWENKRYELEQLAKGADFVLWCLFYGEKDPKVIQAGAKKFIQDEPNSYVSSCCTAYLEQYDEIIKAQAELSEHTKTVAAYL